ncbi:MAG: phosphoribosyltransferase-like protein [Paracoccaceae bacterium]
MINALALNLIADIMRWDNEEATREHAWLRLMSATKYDGYSDFRAGSRFLESFVTWLRQFDQDDRPAAYNFVKNRLVYFSQAEMQRVVEVFVPEIVTPFLRKAAAEEVKIKPWEVWGNSEGVKVYEKMLRRCLFVGLSDGSRIDILRRANSPKLVQDQFVPMLDIGEEKWRDLGKKLTKDQGQGAQFDNIYLIDDFTASGTTFIRRSDEGVWKGKLNKFNDLVNKARQQMGSEFPVVESYGLHIHHYISTHQAREALENRVAVAYANIPNRSWGKWSITEGLRLPETLRMIGGQDDHILDLCERYYDHHLYQRLKEHCDEAGQDNMKLGYANCALPIILEHNSPNNSISLLWAETDGSDGHPMRPLFRRRDRHG